MQETGYVKGKGNKRPIRKINVNKIEKQAILNNRKCNDKNPESASIILHPGM
jgi:hypothetical protein